MEKIWLTTAGLSHCVITVVKSKMLHSQNRDNKVQWFLSKGKDEKH